MTDIGVPAQPSGQVPLRRRVLNAGAWTFAGYGLSLAIRFGSNLLLTRLLAPEMFGVTAIAVIVMVGLAMFSDVGLHQSIVRSSRGDDTFFLNTVWAVQILRGLVLFLSGCGIGVLVALAGKVGILPQDSVYANPLLPWVVSAISLSAFIDGLMSTKGASARRDLKLGRITLMEIISQVVGLCCMFLWIVFDRSIWALIAAVLGASLARVALSHLWLSGSPNRLQWDARAFDEIFHFGKWIFLSSILGFLVANGDRLLLGGLVDARVLGIYAIAFTIFSSVEQLTSRVVAVVALPALSEVVRERRDDLKATYYKFHRAIAASAYFCSGLLVISAPAIIGVLYDHRYADAGWMLRVLAFGLLAVPFQVAVECFLALGLPQLLSRVLIIRLVVLFVCLPAGFHYDGFVGALWGVVASQLFPVIFIIFKARKLGFFDPRKELVILPMIFAGLGAGELIAKSIALWHG